MNELAAEMFGSAGWLLDQDAGCSLGDVAPLLEWLADDHGSAVMRRRLEGCRGNNVPIVIDLSARRSGPGQVLCVLHELREDRLAGGAQRYFDIAFEHAPIGLPPFRHGRAVHPCQLLPLRDARPQRR